LSPIRGVRRVIFKTLEQIPYLLGFAAQPRLALQPNKVTKPPPLAVSGEQVTHIDANPGAVTPPGMRKGTGSNTETNAASGGEMLDQDTHKVVAVVGEVQMEDATEELELDPTVDEETLARSMNTARVQDVVDPPSEKQIGAACTIQTMYRRHLHRRGCSRTKSSEMIHRFFIECLAESKKIAWPRRHYRFLLLGPLPHLLLCLERAITSASESKMDFKRRLTTAAHLEIEDVQMRMTEAKWVHPNKKWNMDDKQFCSRILKELFRLQKELEPKATVHKHRDLPTLKIHVENVEMLICGLPCARELQDHFCVVKKGIVTDPPQKKKPKPALCMEGDDVEYM
jgi:hypothetical protein